MVWIRATCGQIKSATVALFVFWGPWDQWGSWLDGQERGAGVVMRGLSESRLAWRSADSLTHVHMCCRS